MGDEDRSQRELDVRRHWFDRQSRQDQDDIIKPAFEAANPTPQQIKEQAQRYCDDYGKEF